MNYTHLSKEERSTIAQMRKAGYSQAAIARVLQRHPATISRELKRNYNRQYGHGYYSADRAQEQANGRLSRSRRRSSFSPQQQSEVARLIRHDLSPEQVSGRLALKGSFEISFSTIYDWIRRDQVLGGDLYTRLRHSAKRRRKGYGRPDSRGRMRGKRAISERPKGAHNRTRYGHWEIDTVVGPGKACILTLVERKSGLTHIRLLANRTTAEANRAILALIRRHPGRFLTITADNGTEFHGFKEIEARTDTKIYFAAPYHSWERGTNENTNGLIRQYIPKRTSMASLTQYECDRIANKLNDRPRKRLGFYTPGEVFPL